MTDTARPLISVVIPTRDRVALLRRCLDRLTPGAQQLDASRYEVVVSDDGAPGTTAAALAPTHPWVRVVDGPGRGPAANRNRGARAAHGEWLAFTDDDTEPSPQWLAALIAPTADGARVIEGRTICEGGFGSPLFHAPVNETGGKLWSCNFLIASSLFAALGGFDEAFRFPHMEDQDLRERIIGARDRIAFARDALVNHPPRRQPGGAQLGAYRESEVRYLYKHGARRPVKRELLERIARYRIGVIRSTPKSFDSVRALWSLALETAYVLRHVAEWERRYAMEFPERGTA